MSTTLPKITPSHLQLQEAIAYPDAGINSQVLFKDALSQCKLMCLAANTDLSEHTAPRNATVQVVEGRGVFTLMGEDIDLEPGVFIVMPAGAPHGVKATSNLAFLLTFSE
ncbi:cupin domain-containing protein [[Limnothrix rosea] IAM M-220]|uniref:cupin domain-containing protein n=1 Tax=[Limnothrix rosea] IAM M-220 TaxID=454133 RepID=UPI0009629E75|nr:cupin domain-containing protein [[Limnothrix rosea] IAM M-220]OKH12957.1 cupin [[Limnothrix rosea] IAM M-220]